MAGWRVEDRSASVLSSTYSVTSSVMSSPIAEPLGVLWGKRRTVLDVSLSVEIWRNAIAMDGRT